MNTNCLEGYRCPKCKQERKLLVWVVACAGLTDDGTDVYDSEVRDTHVDWDDKSDAECPECGWTGKFGECSIGVQRARAAQRKGKKK